ncbi:MAG: hypothetical protein RBU36_12355 [Thermoanaerobaculia bacterium]|jgi:predicted nucleic acid-binding protein|nr:hypothetical protein [Thermoanaerobaculia bacterium]
MELTEAREILERIERSTHKVLARQLVQAAVRYSGCRAEWDLADAAARAALDPARTAAHDAFIDACNILSRAMAAIGEDNSWRRAIGVERGEIGDFACLLHCVLGLRAR